MNAQKAIEEIEEHLNQTIAAVNSLKRWGERHSVDSLAHFQLIEEGQQRIEALSIVLESAKLLHRHVVPQMESQYKLIGQGFKSVYGVPLEKLGIEEGENE